MKRAIYIIFQMINDFVVYFMNFITSIAKLFKTLYILLNYELPCIILSRMLPFL